MSKNSNQGYHVHIVDDDPDILKLCDQLLKQAGYQAKLYATGEAFLENFDPTLPGCVLLDLRLPGIGGFEIARCLSDVDPKPEIILMSAFENPQSIGLSLMESLIGFLQKPLNEDALIKAVEEAIRRDSLTALAS